MKKICFLSFLLLAACSSGGNNVSVGGEHFCVPGDQFVDASSIIMAPNIKKGESFLFAGCYDFSKKTERYKECPFPSVVLGGYVSKDPASNLSYMSWDKFEKDKGSSLLRMYDDLNSKKEIVDSGRYLLITESGTHPYSFIWGNGKTRVGKSLVGDDIIAAQCGDDGEGYVSCNRELRFGKLNIIYDFVNDGEYKIDQMDKAVVKTVQSWKCDR